MLFLTVLRCSFPENQQNGWYTREVRKLEKFDYFIRVAKFSQEKYFGPLIFSRLFSTQNSGY